ncbi:MAG: 2-phospho-L-lactate transferase [Acidimicrobiaceae bacterium]|nr:2-phospho-L-lactate transferase [Acidimicrobiaceae bacterium]
MHTNPSPVFTSVVVLAGGVGAARFLRGLALVHDPGETTALVNTGDDTVLHGLNISPDVDTVIYTLGGAIDLERGWGLSNETWRAMESLKKYVNVRPAGSVAAPEWFNLGDKDLATHFYRTARRSEGASASEITNEIARAWGLAQQIVPMTDCDVATLLELAENCEAGVAGQQISFQEYFVKHRHCVAVRAVHFQGAEFAKPNCLNELRQAEVVIIAPSNPIVSIGPIRALAGIDSALTAQRDRVVAISPIVGGHALKGPASRMLTELGHESSALGVARLYAPIASTLIIDTVDADLADAIERQGMRCVVTNTVMSTPIIAGELARIALTSITGESR